VALDIDYRPVLWGLTSPGLGERRYVASDAVSASLQELLPLCDLLVGTEEEIRIAGGAGDDLAALCRMRALTPALIVMKRGPMGCIAYADAIPARLEDGLCGPGFPVEVYNVLGAGDAFMAGLLRGWVRNEPLPDALRYANACGALVVSRHGCAPAMPSWIELSHFLAHGSQFRRLRDDVGLEQLHRSTTRSSDWPDLAVLAFDHRAQLEEIASRHGAPRERITAFKQLVASAAEKGYQAAREQHGAAPDDFPAPGVIVDGTYGEEVLCRLSGSGWWIARPVELPGSRPLAFEEGMNVGLALRGWPAEQVVKCLLMLHPDDHAPLLQQQLASVLALQQACHGTGHELLLELIPPRDMPSGAGTLPRAMARVYDAGIRPDWWKLVPPADAQAWAAVSGVIRTRDAQCRGVLLLGLEASEDVLARGFRAAASESLCKGFAVGRSIFGDAARAWMAGQLDDAGVVADVARRYQRLITLWLQSRQGNAVASKEARA
jgi:5-dehydro-2-deoxygluconokinase